MEMAKQVQILTEAICILLSANACERAMYLPPVMDK